MATIKEILQNVKALFDAPVVPPVAPVTPPSILTLKLKDGTDISIALKNPSVEAEPTVGDIVTVAGMPATEGVLELEDGSTITVDATGTITEITNVVPVTPELEAAVAPVAPTVEERLSAIEAELSKMKMAAQPVQVVADTAIPLAMAKQDEVIKGLFELVEKIAELPTAEPKTLVGNKKDQFERMNKKEQALNAIAEGIKSLKNKN
jgi:hypothetical protein